MLDLIVLRASGRFACPPALNYVLSCLRGHVRCVGVLLIGAIFHITGATAEPLTLGQAWQLAELANPDLRQAEAELSAARGEISDTRAPLFNNPEIFGEVRKRNSRSGSDDASNPEGSLGISQIFETGGQQHARRTAAEHGHAAIQQNIEETRRQVRAAVETRFVTVLGLQERIETEAETLRLITESTQIVNKRVSAGEDSRLEGNLAKVEAERAQNQVSLLSEQLTRARTGLATLLQLPPENLPEVTGSLDLPRDNYTLASLLDNAARRPVLRALEFRENAARSRLKLERGATYPDVTLNLFQDREQGIDDHDDVTGLSVSLPLPVFRRNAAGIGRAMTELTQTQIQRQTATRGASAEVLALWEQLESLRSRLARLEQSVLPSLEENLSLSRRSYEEGEIGITQLLLVNRQILDARRDLLDARTDLRQTQIALEVAAGWPATDSEQ